MRKLKAQQVTEFLIAAPILLAFFVMLTEFAFALNAHLTLTNALKSSAAAYYSALVQNKDPKTAIFNKIQTSLAASNMPNTDTLKVEFMSVDSTPVIISTYTYKPDFAFFLLPVLKDMNFSSVVALPSKTLDVSGYSSGFSDGDLETVYYFVNPLPSGEEGEGGFEGEI